MFMVQLFRGSFEAKWFFHYEESAIGFAEEMADRGGVAYLWKYSEEIDGYEMDSIIS